MLGRNVTFRQFDHNRENSEFDMATVIRISAILASGRPVNTDDLYQYPTVGLVDGQIPTFCDRVKVIAWDHSTMSCDAKNELRLIIDTIEDNWPARLIVNADENITTILGVYTYLPDAPVVFTDADLAKYDALVEKHAGILSRPNWAHPGLGSA